MCKIAVIVPIFNVEAYLKRCLDSIKQQTFNNYNLILIDDGAQDLCGVICDEYAINETRIYVVHNVNKGLSTSRNIGIDCAITNRMCEWINFIDSDDWVHRRYLEALIQATDRINLQVISCNHAYTTGEALKVDENSLESEILTSKDYYCGAASIPAVTAWAKLYRRECFNDIRYPEGRWHEDEFITYRIIFQSEFIAWIKQPLYAYYQNRNGIMYSKNLRKHNMDLLDSHYEQIKFFENKSIRLRNHALKKCIEIIEKVKNKTDKYTPKDIKHINEIKQKIKRNYSMMFYVVLIYLCIQNIRKHVIK